MKVKATVSFSGVITMTKNEVRECVKSDALKDLLNCGYVIPVEDKKAVNADETKRGNTTRSKK